MTDLAGNLALAQGQGYQVLGHFPLENRAWWDEYLGPLNERAQGLAGQAQADPALAQVLAENQQEITVWRRHGASFGYVFYLLRRLT
jgi:serine/threonine-protein kinase HipA